MLFCPFKCNSICHVSIREPLSAVIFAASKEKSSYHHRGRFNTRDSELPPREAASRLMPPAGGAIFQLLEKTPSCGKLGHAVCMELITRPFPLLSPCINNVPCEFAGVRERSAVFRPPPSAINNVNGQSRNYVRRLYVVIYEYEPVG